MWFRIETEKDGTVRSCVQVDESFKNSGNVFYIEADSKEKALGLVDWHLKKRANERESAKQRAAARRAAGRCKNCPEPSLPGRDKCARHLAAQSEYNARYHKLGPEKPRATDLEEAARRRWQRERVHSAGGNARSVLSCLRRVSEAYIRDPDGFAEWLTEQIEAVEAQIYQARQAVGADVHAPQAAE